jgi:phosphinothricin acetyltransferase
MKIRDARTSDAPEILEIYRPHIEKSAVSFELTVPSIREIESRIGEYSKLGWLVAEGGDGRIGGYAYACKHRTREAYQWCCEVSVYVAPEFLRKGLGKTLYLSLFERLRERGYVNAYAGITLPNPQSVGFHEALGFTLIGRYPKIGYKLGEWRDVGWWGLTLQPHPKTPAPVRSQA